MKPSVRFLHFLLIISFLAVGHSASAHNLFVLMKNSSDENPQFDVIFEHAPRPGDGAYNQPLLERGVTWVEPLGQQESVSLELEEVERNGKKFLRTEMKHEGPFAVLHSCKWGVYHGRLDYFHGKYIHANSMKSLGRLARNPKLPLDIAPTLDSERVKMTVFFEGKPLADTRVWVWSPEKESKKQTTDSTGTITIEPSGSGIYSASTIHILEEPAGEFEGEPYRGVMHGTTCSFRFPIEKSDQGSSEGDSTSQK